MAVKSAAQRFLRMIFLRLMARKWKDHTGRFASSKICYLCWENSLLEAASKSASIKILTKALKLALFFLMDIKKLTEKKYFTMLIVSEKKNAYVCVTFIQKIS